MIYTQNIAFSNEFDLKSHKYLNVLLIVTVANVTTFALFFALITHVRNRRVSKLFLNFLLVSTHFFVVLHVSRVLFGKHVLRLHIFS